MNLKQMVKNVKNYVKMASKGGAFIELFDVEDNSVIFEVPTIDDIQVGVPASPDGEFIFSDGMKDKAKGEEEIPSDEKDKKIEELKQMVSDLKAQLEELKKNVVEKDSTIEEAEKELEEIKNFYVDLNKSSIAGRKGNEEGIVFSFKKNKK